MPRQNRSIRLLCNQPSRSTGPAATPPGAMTQPQEPRPPTGSPSVHSRERTAARPVARSPSPWPTHCCAPGNAGA
jgi:hypothetical protein